MLIIMPYVSPGEMIIDCVVMFLDYSDTEQEIHTNTSKYRVWESKSSMDVLQKISLMIDHIAVISWYIKILQELSHTGRYTGLLFYIDPIMFVLINIIIVYPQKIIIPQVLLYFNKNLKVLFIIQNSSTWFHVNLILHPPHSVIH